MHRLPVHIKSIAAAVLLGLLVYILVEKNAHGHTASATRSQQTDHATIHSGYTCLICEFQLSAEAELPAAFTNILPLSYIIIYSELLPVIHLNLTPSPFAERGPPAFS